jgi:hypothetical protein
VRRDRAHRDRLRASPESRLNYYIIHMKIGIHMNRSGGCGRRRRDAPSRNHSSADNQTIDCGIYATALEDSAQDAARL